MKSVLRARDKIINTRHEFGEASGPRYWATFIDEGGHEVLVAFTPKQIEEARKRAIREPEDAALFRAKGRVSGVERDAAWFVSAVLTLAAVAILVGWALGWLP